MRPRFLLALLAIAVAVLGAMVLFRHSGTENSQTTNPTSPGQAITNGVLKPNVPNPSPPLGQSVQTAAAEPRRDDSSNDVTATRVLASTKNQKNPASRLPDSQTNTFVRARIEKLERLGRENDPQSFEFIVADLTNSSRAVRAAAREAAIQFGNRDAVLNLKQAAALLEDPREKVAFLDAADFLDLPSLNEVQLAGTNKAAPRIGGRSVRQPQPSP